MSSNGTFPTTTPRWLVEVRTYWAALTTERKYHGNDRSSEERERDERQGSEPRED